MSDIGVSYAGYWRSYSGMGEASRNIIKALHTAGVDITTQIVENMTGDQNLGPAHRLCETLHGKPVDYDIKIIHTTPDLITKYLEPTKYHIFHLFWETDRLPDWWVWALNLCDEVWTGCERDKQVFKKSGVKTPIWICPQPSDTQLPPFEPLGLHSTAGNEKTNIDKDVYYFYSIFQWIERKGWRNLLEAYYTAFDKDDRVALVIKTYVEKFAPSERNQIHQDILKIKDWMKLKDSPPIYLITDLLSRGELYSLHQTGDCFVLPHRGEGWGIPIAEAMSMGKPVITTKLGGITDYIPKDAYYALDYDKVPVFNMKIPWYEEGQKWGNANTEQLTRHMRTVYENQSDARAVGDRGLNFITSTLSYDVVGAKMKQRLQEIQDKL